MSPPDPNGAPADAAFEPTDWDDNNAWVFEIFLEHEWIESGEAIRDRVVLARRNQFRTSSCSKFEWCSTADSRETSPYIADASSTQPRMGQDRDSQRTRLTDNDERTAPWA